ncbi:MAG: hypothetical protein HY919_02220 [Elusimicrobia bacterium]|nr:hypothetical protein [Elusimicrobiota bacterium]
MTLIDVYKKVVLFLNKQKFNYIVIGGIPAGILGEPRATVDVDIDIILNKKDITGFLRKAEKAGFEFDEKKCVERAKQSGSFQINLGEYHIDFIIASIDLEEEAIKRRKIIETHNVKANFPTPEDLILLKIIPGRPKDIIDAENIAQRHSGKLDKKYLLGWSQKLSDEAEDMRIYKEVERLLKL